MIEESVKGEAVIALIGGVFAFFQALSFFILADLRSRIARLEDKFIRVAK
ncbi:MAG TPA: hypothetical protein VGR55_01325 [Candidatus Acidoferrum sp.]|nr:hypothetical protein [Candidatus Acidoferrum sp.]